MNERMMVIILGVDLNLLIYNSIMTTIHLSNATGLSALCFNEGIFAPHRVNIKIPHALISHFVTIAKKKNVIFYIKISNLKTETCSWWQLCFLVLIFFCNWSHIDGQRGGRFDFISLCLVTPWSSAKAPVKAKTLWFSESPCMAIPLYSFELQWVQKRYLTHRNTRERQ